MYINVYDYTGDNFLYVVKLMSNPIVYIRQ
jgi:hypothetical protein